LIEIQLKHLVSSFRYINYYEIHTLIFTDFFNGGVMKCYTSH